MCVWWLRASFFLALQLLLVEQQQSVAIFDEAGLGCFFGLGFDRVFV